jgi:hypothetical protein
MVLLQWADSVVQNDFAQSRASPEAKDALVKAVFGYVYRFHLLGPNKTFFPPCCY